MDVVFVCAMDCEAAAVIANMEELREEISFGRRVVRGLVCGRELAVVTCGIGKCNAAAGAQLAIGTLGAKRIVNIGVSGGLTGDMKVFGTYSVDKAVQYDFNLAKLNGTSRGVLNEYSSPYLPLVPITGFESATCATGDSFTDDETDIGFLVNDLQAKLRDMEIGAIAHVCERTGVSVSSLKTVTDVHGVGESMTGQYKINLAKALEILKDLIPTLVKSL